MVNTRDDMVSEIQSILRRTTGGGSSANVIAAIDHNIGQLQSEAFFFNETRSTTFNTVAGQAWYDEDDDADIPLFASFEALFITITGDERPLARQFNIGTFELLASNSNNQGKPSVFIYRNSEIGLYPVPDDAYQAKFIGGMHSPAPGSGAEEGNVWMTVGYRAVMYSTLAWINRFRVRDYKLAEEMDMQAEKEKSRLSITKNRRKGGGRIRPISW